MGELHKKSWDDIGSEKKNRINCTDKLTSKTAEKLAEDRT